MKLLHRYEFYEEKLKESLRQQTIFLDAGLARSPHADLFFSLSLQSLSLEPVQLSYNPQKPTTNIFPTFPQTRAGAAGQRSVSLFI